MLKRVLTVKNYHPPGKLLIIILKLNAYIYINIAYWKKSIINTYWINISTSVSEPI